MSFQSRAQVPITNDTGNVLESQAIGNKTDTAVVAVGTDKSLMAYAKGILNTVVALGTNQLDVAIYGPQVIDVNNTGHFEAMLTDRDTGLIPVGSITPGTYSINRIRGGVESVVVAAGAAFQEATGRVFVDYTFAAASWSTDDGFKLIPAGDTIVAIGGVNYYPAIPVMSGLVQDISTIEGTINTIESKVDTANTNIGSATTMHQGTGSRVDDADLSDMVRFMADSNALEATLGAPTSVAGTIVGDIAAVTTAVGVVGTDVGDASAGTLGSIYAILGNPASSISSVVGTNLVLAVGAGSAAADQPINAMVRWGIDNLARTSEVETSTLDVGDGSLADHARAGELLRYVADNMGGGSLTEVETSSLHIGDGAVLDNSRLGLLVRWLADNANTVIPDAAGVVATFLGVAGANLTDVASADIGAASGSTLGSVYGILGNPATSLSAQIAAIPVVTPDAAGTAAGIIGAAGASLTAAGGDTKTEVESTSLNQGAGSRANLARAGSLIRYIADTAYATNNRVASTAMGMTQVFRKSVNQAADVGDYALASTSTGDVLIKSLTVRASGATSADLTNIGIYADNKLVTLITTVDGVKANLAAAGNQVSSGPTAIMLPVGQSIVMTLTGTGATNVVFTVDIEYIAVNASGGYLV